MSRLTTILLVVLCSCGASKQARDAETKAWSEFQATISDVYKLEHACDAEQTAYQKTYDAYLATPVMSAIHASMSDDKEKAEAYVNACFKNQADYVEGKIGKYDRASYGSTSRSTHRLRAERLTKAADAWLDACVSCAKAQDCISRYREATRLEADARKEYKRPPLCG
jgi:hypothetical protein